MGLACSLSYRENLLHAMISVISCSTSDARLGSLEAMYSRALNGAPMEMIPVRSPHSLTTGYNEGASRAKGEILIFSHDDVDIFSPNLEQILRQSLAESDLVGMAGTTRLVSPKWLAAGPPYLFGQVLHRSEEPNLYSLNIFGTPSRAVHNIQGLDGVFMAARRELWEQHRFDEKTFDGFHLYDIDFSFGAYLRGRKICVRNDIQLFHESSGDFSDPKWTLYADRFAQKYRGKLPEHWKRYHQWSGTYVRDFDEARTLMTPEYWDRV